MQVLMRPHRRGQVPEVESAMSLSSNLLSSASATAGPSAWSVTDWRKYSGSAARSAAASAPAQGPASSHAARPAAATPASAITSTVRRSATIVPPSARCAGSRSSRNAGGWEL